jgi:hypothetical protein
VNLTREQERACLARAVSVVAVLLPMPPDASEDYFQSEVVKLADRNGWLHYHTFDSRRCVAGFPDLMLLRGGVCVVAELKVKKNRPTAAQRRWLAEFEAVPGLIVRHWRPEHWPEIVTLLTADPTPPAGSGKAVAA